MGMFCEKLTLFISAIILTGFRLVQRIGLTKMAEFLILLGSVLFALIFLPVTCLICLGALIVDAFDSKNRG